MCKKGTVLHSKLLVVSLHWLRSLQRSNSGKWTWTRPSLSTTHLQGKVVNTITDLIHSHIHVYYSTKERENLHVNFTPNNFHCLLHKAALSYQGWSSHTTCAQYRVHHSHTAQYITPWVEVQMTILEISCLFSSPKWCMYTRTSSFLTFSLPHFREMLNHEATH